MAVDLSAAPKLADFAQYLVGRHFMGQLESHTITRARVASVNVVGDDMEIELEDIQHRPGDFNRGHRDPYDWQNIPKDPTRNSIKLKASSTVKALENGDFKVHGNLWYSFYFTT